MKVLITNMHNFNGGGHVTYIKSILAGLKDRHEMVVATPHTSRLYRQAQDIAGVRVIGQKFTSRLSRMLPEVLRLRRLLKHERFDVVHVNGAADHRHIMLARLGLRHRPAIVWTKHNTKPANSLGNRIRAWAGTDSCIAVCDFVASILRNSGYGGKPITTVRLGLDIEKMPPIDPNERRAARQGYVGDRRDLLILGSVGGTDYEKGWLDLVAAAASMEPELRVRVRIIVAGDPPPEQRLATLRDLGMEQQVILPGLLRSVRPVLAASDIGFVLSHEEAASYASLETMAAGLPTLVSDAGGLPENVRDGQDGWVVPAGDIAAIAQVLRSIFQGRADLARLGASARERVSERFSSARLCRETEAVYRKAAEKTRHSKAPER